MAAPRPGDPPILVAAANRARDVLDWEPRHSSLDEIVSSAWRWHAQHNKRPARVGSIVHEPVGMFPLALPIAP